MTPARSNVVRGPWVATPAPQPYRRPRSWFRLARALFDLLVVFGGLFGLLALAIHGAAALLPGSF